MSKLSRNKGITLVSLVITIIVMLILAGVSLNMVTGDSSVLKMATTATYAQSAGAMSDFFKTYALGTYNAQNYEAAGVDLLEKDGFVTRRINVIGNDVFYMYIVNRDKVEEAMQSNISEGYNAEDNLTDLYGVNPDYSVYYINIDGEVIFGECKYVTIPDGEKVQPKDPVVTDVLQTVFNTDEITAGNLKGVTELRINENNDLPNIKNLDMLYYFPDLKSLYIYKTDLDNMDGLKYCKGITYLYMDTNTVVDYSGISELINLRDIQFYNLYTNARWISNEAMGKIFAALSPLEKLVSFRMYTYQQNANLNDAGIVSAGIQGLRSKSRLIQFTMQNATLTGEIDVSGCSSLQTLYISDNLNPAGTSGVTKIKGLGDCKNLTKVDFEYNKLATLDGLEKITPNLTECYLANNSNPALTLTDAQIAKIKAATSYTIPFQFSTDFGKTDINVSGAGLEDEKLKTLKGNTALKTLNISNNPNISFEAVKEVLPTLTGLESLSISSNSQIKDLSWILDASGNCVFPNLKTFNLNKMGSSFTDFDKIGKISTLTSLNIGDNDGLTHLNFLSGTPNLTSLSITYARKLTNVEGLQHVKKLTSISIYQSPATDISALKHLTSLTSLNMGNCNSVDWNNTANTDALNALVSLKSVMMGGSSDNWKNLNLSSIQPMINRCTSGLDFMAYTSNASVRAKWVEDLKNLSSIQQITLVYALYDQSERVIEKVDFSGCTNLKNLKISGPFAIKELVISGCTNLEELYCNKLNGGSYITLPDITNNKKLKKITWTYNLLNDTDIIKLAAQLAEHTNNVEFIFNNNAVTDISPLNFMVGRITKLELKGNNLYNTDGNNAVKAALAGKLVLD